jgi:DNA repair photolyase
LKWGFSIGTADDSIRKMFEPYAPSIQSRLNALDQIHSAGIYTFVMIAPILPGAEGLPELLAGKTDHVILDRMNYNHSDWVYRKNGLEKYQTVEFFEGMQQQLTAMLTRNGISV